MLTEVELKAILDTPEADRTPEQKKALADFFANGSKQDEKKEDKKKSNVPESWEEIFQHPRFRELNQAKIDAENKAAALEKAAQDAELEALEKQKNYQKLYEKAQAEVTSLKPKAEQLAEMEKTLASMLKTEISSLPEQFQDIVPDGLSTQQKLDWLARNKAKFMKPESFDIGAGEKGAKAKEQKKTELTAEEKQAARDFGMTEEEYAKHRDQTPA